MINVDVAELIDLVHSKPSIYDKRHKDYKDRRRTRAIWNQIGEELGARPEDCFCKWENLRDNYRRHKKKIKGKTGAALKRITPYTWYEYLRWLDPHMGRRG